MRQTESAMRYASPLGEILLTADEIGLTGLWLAGQRPAAAAETAPPERPENSENKENKGRPALLAAAHWLDAYFAGAAPAPDVPLHLRGTAFQQEVWALLREIPYGQTTTYGALARRLAAAHGRARMSAQAVGGAVGRNPVSILVPCHRVIGAGGNLTGYAGGLEAKIALLAVEGVDVTRLHCPPGARNPV